MAGAWKALRWPGPSQPFCCSLGLGEDAGGLWLHIELAGPALDLRYLGELRLDQPIGLDRIAAGALDEGAG